MSRLDRVATNLTSPLRCLGNQYGDCKDKATLLASLLAAAGYKADTVLIGAGIRFNEAVPSPAAFNHAITVVSLGVGSAVSSASSVQTIWLDSTQEVAPYRALLAIERDKPVLRIPVDGPAHLDHPPAKLPFESVQRFEATGALDAEGVVKSRITFSFRGDDEIALRAAVRQVSPAQYDQAAQYLVSSWGFGGKVTHATFTPPEHTDEAFVMACDYEREKPGGDWDNGRIVALDAPDGLPVIDEKEPPQLPMDLGTPRTMTQYQPNDASVRLECHSAGGNPPGDPVAQLRPQLPRRTWRFDRGEDDQNRAAEDSGELLARV